MTADRIAALEALLAETEQAHGVYETTELHGVYDQDWARWYADYVVEHGIGAILGRDVAAHEVARVLATTWDELQRTDPKLADPWGVATARAIATELLGPPAP